EGHKGAQMALETAQKPSRFLSTVQIVITLVGTIAGAFGGATVATELELIFSRAGMAPELAGSLSFSLVVIITTFLSVVFGELVPKSIALSRPESIAAFVSYPMRFFSILFLPIVKILSSATDLTLMLLGTRHGDDPLVTEEEVKVLIAQGTEMGIFDERERKMFEGVLYLGDRKVTTFMTPRTEIVYIDKEDASDAQLQSLIDAANYGHLPLVDGDLDHVLGVIRVKPVLAAVARGEFTGITPFIDQPLFVPETLGALDLFSRFKEVGCRIAIIVDEYGGGAGLVTFSDLAEAILGEASAVGEQEEPDVVRREDGSYLIDGSLSIDSFCEQLGINRDDLGGEFETVAGFVLDRMGSIPRTGESFEWQRWRVEIVDMDGNRIDKLLVTPPPVLPEGDETI
ncbi:MAG: HlyC/CorC family transporter, partial [Spirochaetales bacterium]|nr:HlyC/CorC family transporter [Spirochaetales bacterium]